MSNKHKKSHVRESKDFSASTATASEQGANREILADEKIEGKDERLCEHNDKADTDNLGNAHADTDRQEQLQIDASVTTADTRWTMTCGKQEVLGGSSNAKSPWVNNPGQRDEAGIRASVEVALGKLNEADAKAKEDHDKVDADDERRKSDIVKDLAKEFEGKIPMDSIAAEIVHQLVDVEMARHGKSKVSKRLIYKCLDPKYRRQWQKKHKDEDQEQSAPVHFNKKEVVSVITLGGENETVAEPTGASPQSIDMHMTGEDSKFPGPRDISPVCKNCSIKDNMIKKLEDENRELSVRCRCAESSNSELLLKLTAQENYINKLLEEEHDLSQFAG